MNEDSANIYIAKYTASQVSKYIVTEMNRSRTSITDLRVVRLLYLIQAYYIKTYGRPLFINEIYVTAYGVDIQYAISKRRGCCAMRVDASCFTDEEDIDDDDKETIDKVLARFENYGDHDLTDLIMKQAPWKEARSRLARLGGFGNVITKKSLYDHYHRDHKKTEKEFKIQPKKSESKPKHFRVKQDVVKNFFGVLIVISSAVLGFKIDTWTSRNVNEILAIVNVLSKIFLSASCAFDIGDDGDVSDWIDNAEKYLRSCIFEEVN